MARSRNHGNSYVYGEWHRNEFPKLYVRDGHRLDMADRDFTEFCHYCKRPLLISEEVRYVGQNLNDKGTSVTRQLAELARLPAYLVGWDCDRPREIDQEIDRLNRQILDLEARFPITAFRLKQLFPGETTRITIVTPADWAQRLRCIHLHHYRSCSNPRASEAVDYAALVEMKTSNPLFDGMLLPPDTIYG